MFAIPWLLWDAIHDFLTTIRQYFGSQSPRIADDYRIKGINKMGVSDVFYKKYTIGSTKCKFPSETRRVDTIGSGTERWSKYHFKWQGCKNVVRRMHAREVAANNPTLLLLGCLVPELIKKYVPSSTTWMGENRRCRVSDEGATFYLLLSFLRHLLGRSASVC